MNIAVEDLLDPVLDMQKRAWLEGGRPTVEDLVSRTFLSQDSGTLLDLIYNEIVIREEMGENPAIDDYTCRYPELSEELKLHFEVHRALQADNLVETEGFGPLRAAAGVPLPAEGMPTLAQYEILSELGRGGMGVVYKARHRRLKRLVAVKMFHPGRQPSDRELERFRSEAESIARLQHPNVVQVFEVGQESGLPFLVLEFIEKGSLAERLQELPLAPVAAAELVETLSRAIHHAHEKHIVHRDLKPANVLLGNDGTPKITDFGLAKILEKPDGHADVTQTGEALGTPRYMSPEQAAGRHNEIGPSTDIYALGTILYECLTGQVPFVSASVFETMEKIRHDEPVSPRRLQRKIARSLDTICLKCLHKQPAKRYLSAAELADDLRRFLNGEPVHARRTPAWERTRMWSVRHPSFATAIAACILLVVAGLTALGVQHRREMDRLDKLRDDVVHLVDEGKQALERQDDRTAKEKFLTALSKVLAEPALYDQGLGIRGWLDHALRDGEQHRWRKRPSPVLFDEKRDRAYLIGLLIDLSRQDGTDIARGAIQDALALTLADDTAWLREREQLILMDADMLLRQGDPANALITLDGIKNVSYRVWYERRSRCLVSLGRNEEASRERVRAEQSSSPDSFEFFLNGVDRFHRHDFSTAVRDFDRVLAGDPDHFAGRFFQAATFLELKRPGEAKVGLTACIGQRPQFAWNYLYRGQACLQLGEYANAGQDFQSAIEMNADESADGYLKGALASLDSAIRKLPEDKQQLVWNEQIRTDRALRSLYDLCVSGKRKQRTLDK